MARGGYFVSSFKPSNTGLLSIMKSAGVQEAVGSSAEEMASEATGLAAISGAYYGSKVKVQKKSAHGYVFTGNYKAIQDNAEFDTLHKAMGG